jgi:hypothetical protein
MDKSYDAPPADRTFAALADAHDLRSAITAALTAQPTDEQSLRCAVWTYVGAERDAGMPPGRVIAALSDLVEAAVSQSRSRGRDLTRRVILWSVEAYFGHLGGGDIGTVVHGDAPGLHAR